MTTINKLVKDIYEVLQTKGGWDEALSEFMGSEVRDLFNRRFLPSENGQQSSGLRLSQLGTPCKRKLWYKCNQSNEGESPHSGAYLKFIYGDLLELLLISLARAAGHTVEGCQEELSVAGIKGHRDCVIDGYTVDIKSASPTGFAKFRDGKLREDDPFGYISQLSSYVYAGRNSEVESHQTIGAFLVVDKVSGALCLDVYDFSNEIDQKEQEAQEIKDCVANENPPERAFEAVDDGYWNPKKKQFVTNGNKKLGIQCSYCEFKHICWSNLRTFMYSKGGNSVPVYYTHIVKEPKVMEVTNG